MAHAAAKCEINYITGQAGIIRQCGYAIEHVAAKPDNHIFIVHADIESNYKRLVRRLKGLALRSPLVLR